MNLIIVAVIIMGSVAFLLAIILYVTSQKFAVYEDPKLSEVAAVLPQANCGGCGYPGCKSFAEACVKSDTLEGKYCPVGGDVVMGQVASLLGLSVERSEPKVAVVRCNGSCENRPHFNRYDGIRSCAIEAALYEGETGCSYGCLGCGDCVSVCSFDAVHINEKTGLPEVDEDKCTACGSCVDACPRNIIELRFKKEKSRRVYVSCMNKDKGAIVRKVCNVGCIGCGKCEKTCRYDAIAITDHLAYIDYSKCCSCGECVDVCPQHTILTSN